MREPDANGWMPIETFSKDCHDDVLIATQSYLGGVVMASWFDNVPNPAFIDIEGDSYFDVTHWQPLPKPPVQS